MIRRFGFPKVIEMTAAALGREPLPVERSHRPYFVTGVAVDCRVRPNQWKPVHMLVDVVGGYLPASVSMTLVALGSVLAAVNISMAVLALLAYIDEHWIGMAFLTLQLGMEAAQRESGLSVLKLWDGPKGSPALRGVTVFTPYIQVSMRIHGRHGYCRRVTSG